MAEHDHDEGPDRDVLEEKSDDAARPDRPSDSQQATLAERGEGAHDEYADAPASMAEAEGDTETRERESGRPDDVHAGAGPADEPRAGAADA